MGFEHNSKTNEKQYAHGLQSHLLTYRQKHFVFQRWEMLTKYLYMNSKLCMEFDSAFQCFV